MKIAMLLLALSSLFLIAQTPAQAPVPSYSAEQARKGQTLFYENCAECHGAALQGNFAPALAGPDGNVQWDTIAYLWTYVTEHMPAGNAGGLTREEYVNILAFLMKMHGHAPGAKPLTPQAANASQAFLGP